MNNGIGYRKDLWLTIIGGSCLVILVIILGFSFFITITDAETNSKKRFLRKQTELAATEIEIATDRFEVNAENLIDYLEDEDLDADDYRDDLTKAVRRVFSDYPGLIDTVWVNLQDSTIFLTRTERNDFIRKKSTDGFPKKDRFDYKYYSNGKGTGFELVFSLNPVRFTRDFVTHFYLNKGGNKLLMLGDELRNLDQNMEGESQLEIDEASYQQIHNDVSIGVMGVYEVDWKKGTAMGTGVLAQYPFDFGDFYENASILFLVESELTSGIYSTYLFLFSGFVFLLIGTVVFFTLSLQNRMKSQKLLEESGEEISELFDQQNILLKELRGFVFFHNYKGEITRVSDEVEQILGHPKSAYLEAFKSEVKHEDVEKVINMVQDALSQNKTFVDMEFDFVKPDGKKVRLKIFEKLVFDELGRYNGGLGICTDVTSQFERKQELIESGKRLQNLIDNIPDIIFTYANDGIVLDSHIRDQKFLKSLGHSMIGASLFDLVPINQREQTQFAFNLARKTEQIQTVDLSVLSGHESQYFEVRFFPLDANRMMSIAKDTTSQRIWEKGLVEAMNSADQASRAKSEFLANMSHEIRTPMNGLLGIIDLLDQTDLNPGQLEYLDIIKNSGNSLLAIIKDILDYSKIEAGKIDLNMSVFCPADELSKQIQIFYGLAQKNGIVLKTSYEPRTKEWMEGDVKKINQVILNLVGNAVKFTSNGGIVSVKLGLENISGDIYYLRCSVEDSGIGIPADEILKLTDPFYQVESSNTRTYQGTGLGLAIAKKVVELMGGELTISSELGKGSVFEFSVILKKAPDLGMVLPSSEKPNRTNWNGMAKEYPANILLAEDNDLNLQLMTLMLGQLGYAFQVARNGKEALEMAGQNDYDIILMDVQMPILNGLEASIAIRELKNGNEVFIIGLSANVFDEDQKKAIAAGMNDYLNKPIRLLGLAEMIQKYSLKPKSGSKV
ncbi:PAS domain S-box-containing protein [Algoriphagus ratkowskyi]|uniref:Sensory/regulatory protein RpfC n=1 Tax=Algoriphagus ratkowskyi TaxID=57028 RepID=A0A2W7R000_9BACT|nr:PAS domain-containing hybrid sensor histidine kinase/response regulator [Algoriphagus ratkowskyi]PZX53844.1 PAS domain S-box-containing protein [Algoriphagus ratkowskyi]TXD76751.1 response regulator [Algoriphagus ratkowskyi]